MPACLGDCEGEGLCKLRRTPSVLGVLMAVSMGTRERDRNFVVHSYSPANTNRDFPPGATKVWAGQGLEGGRS